MAFLSPLFLVGALAAAVPIVLHLLRREPEARVRFSAVKLLRQAPVEFTRKRQLRELILMALRIAALLLLALAFARPFITAGAAAASTITIVAVDTSASMSAPGRFEKARELAKQEIDRAVGVVAVVAFSDAASVVAVPSADKAIARSAVDASSAGAGGTSYRAALTTAADLLQGRTGTIVVVTDLQDSGWDAGDRVALPEAVHVEIADVGPAPPNFAVTAARVRGDRVVATVRNAAAAAREARVSLLVRGDLGARATATPSGDAAVAVGPNQSADVSFSLPRARWASVTVEDREGAVQDNARYLVLEGSGRPSVLILTTNGDLAHEAFYLQQAIVAPGIGGQAYDVEGVGGVGLQSWEQARLDTHPAVILMSTAGLDHHARAMLADYIRRGGGMLVASGPAVDGDVLADVMGSATIVPSPTAGAADAGLVRSLAVSDVRHPAFEPLGGAASLGLVRFKRVSVVRAGDCAVLAKFTTGEAALFDCERGQGRVMLLASDLDNQGNDFPLHASFVPFLHGALGYLSGARRSVEYVIGQVPPGVAPVPGVVSFAAAGAAPRLISVNVDPAESDGGRLTAEEFQTAVTRLKDVGIVRQTSAAGEQEERQHLWQYLLAVMIAMLVAESFVAARIA